MLLKKRTEEAGMDLYEPMTDQSADFQTELNRRIFEAQAGQGSMPQPGAMLAVANGSLMGRHRRQFPLGKNMFALMIIALSDL